MVMNNSPYRQKVNKGIKTRVFDKSLKESDLKWHRDKNNRYIKVISGKEWKIQLENSFPVELVEGKTYFINSKKWHRLIKGKNNLVIKIKEINDVSIQS